MTDRTAANASVALAFKRPRGRYLAIATAILVSEILIATKFATLAPVRGALGDFLVVIMLYCGARAVCDIAPGMLSSAVFLFACTVEGTQYFHLADAMGLPRGSVAGTLMGNTFSMADILMYFLGCLTAHFSDTHFLLKGFRRDVAHVE